jgi:glycosyltransferase involved in cell wall biosynthesis
MSNNNWTKGKCALKVLQYMATGLPVISSPYGVNAYVVEHGVNGYLATDSKDWSALIIQLSEQKGNLAQMGNKGKARVQNEFSIDIVFQKILSVISS